MTKQCHLTSRPHENGRWLFAVILHWLPPIPRPSPMLLLWDILITVSAFTNTLEETLEPRGDIEVKVIFAAMSPVREPRRNCSQGTGSSLLSELCFELVDGLEIKDGFAYPHRLPETEMAAVTQSTEQDGTPSGWSLVNSNLIDA